MFRFEKGVADAGLSLSRLPVSWAISKFVVEASSAEEQMAVEVLLQDLKRSQQLFTRPPVRDLLLYPSFFSLTAFTE